MRAAGIVPLLIVMLLMALVVAVTVGVVLFARSASGAPTSTPPPPNGRWAPDPSGLHELRWWDGAAWTPSVSDAGVPGHDPL